MARLTGALGAALGALVLIGWMLDHHRIKSIIPGAVEMKANTALGLLLAGPALLPTRRSISGGRRPLTQVLATMVLVIGLATMAEYLFGWHLGIDELLFVDHAPLFTSAPGRMSPYSTVAFTALGLGLLLLPMKGWHWVSGAAGAAAAAIGTFSLLGYLWNAAELVTDQVVPPVAVHTAAGFLILGFGLLVASSTIRHWIPAGSGRVTELDQPVLLAWFGAFLVIVLIGGNAYRVSVSAAAAADSAHRTQGIQVVLGRLYGDLSDAESTQRAYILTGDAPLLREYFALTARVREGLADLRLGLADGDPERLRQVELLGMLTADRLTLLDRHVQVYRDDGLAAAQLAIRNGAGVRLMSAVDSLIRAIDREEARVLGTQRAAATDHQRATLAGLLVMAVVASLGFFILFVIIRRIALRRETAERALRASEEHLMVTLRSIGDGVLVTDAEARVTSLNTVGEALTGWSEAEAIGRPVREVFDLRVEGSDDPAYVPVDDVLRLGVTRSLTNHSELASRDGTLRAVADSCAPIHDAEGTVVGAVLVFRDVTPERDATREIERQQRRLADLNTSLEERVETRTHELQESEQRFANLFESAPDALLVVSPDGKVSLANHRAELLFGRPRNVLAGMAMEALVPLARHDRLLEQNQRFSHSPGAEWAGEPDRQVMALAADGTEVPVELSLSAVDAPDGRVTTVAIRDITDRVRLEEQFHQAQRMETVGQLAGGIAHDFNNLLSVINNTADLAGDGLAPDDPMRVELAAIHDAGTRAAALTRQLLAFSRRTLMQPEVVDLSVVVTEMQPMLSRLLGEHIAISCRGADGSANVRIDPAQLEQVILNLGVNSRDAMPGGGELRIETSKVHLDAAYCRQHAGVAPGEYVLLAVTDTGQGMDLATRERIFEPFFTTKGPGKGTGLGLATVYGIVKQAGGDIWVYSEVGRGTTMKIYLPAVADADAGTEPARTSPEAPARGGETLLVVEDEIALQRVVRRILEGAGFRVLLAGSAEEALEHARREGHEIDLLLTDVVMPGMSGRELAAEILALHARMPILFTSGYTDDTIMHHGVLEAGVAFISKPYSAQELARKVREVLDGAR